MELGADDIKLFSMLMRRNSLVVPNIFVFEIEADTKVYFPWSDYPIRTYSKGIVRKISCEDCKKDFRCGNPNIDKNSLSDFFKNQEHSYNQCFFALVFHHVRRTVKTPELIQITAKAKP